MSQLEYVRIKSTTTHLFLAFLFPWIGLSTCPRARSLAHEWRAQEMLMVANSNIPIHSRLWCVYEAPMVRAGRMATQRSASGGTGVPLVFKYVEIQIYTEIR